LDRKYGVVCIFKLFGVGAKFGNVIH